MEKTRKEVLTKENIVKDLLKAENEFGTYKIYNYFSYMIPIILLSIIIVTSTNIYMGIVVFLFAVYPLIQLIREIYILKMRKQAIRNGEFTITMEKLSHIAKEAIPKSQYGFSLARLGSRWARMEVDFLYFSYQKWRIPIINYTWSNVYKMSKAGIKNTSLIGDEFYVVTNNDNHEIGCAYNTKFFEAKNLM